MAFGKLYTYENNPRSTAIRAVAKANDLQLDIVDVDTTNPSPEYLKLNKLGKVPTFEGEDGYVLYECVAIAIYNALANSAQSQYATTPPELLPPRSLDNDADPLKQSQNEKTTLLGKTKQDYASILKWTSYFNTEVLPSLGKWYRPLIGRDPYNKKAVDDASKAAAKAIATVEEHLKHNTYLVGERITLADLFAVGVIARGFEFFFDKKWRQENPNVSRWYETVYNQPIYSAVAPKFELLDTPKLTNAAPKKPEQPKKEAKKEAPKPAAEEDAPAPKPKHPLEALPRATFALDEWKRYYSNHDEAESMKWFWENCNFDEFSIWKFKYKYNDELTLVFMSNNLVGGFNTRLEASRKYLFGCGSVYGENNDSVIEGAFVIRGDDYLPVFDVAPDYESYEFEKLDPKNPEHRAYVEAQWTWDKPIVHNGKEYKHADGKVFK